MSLFGAHVSIAGGIYKAPIRGEELECDAIQVFTKNQMQWSAKPLKQEDTDKFKMNMEKYRPNSVMTHDSYLINLGSPEDKKLEKSRNAFLDEIQRCDQLGIDLLVFHPGSHLEAGERRALDTIADSLNWAHEQTPDASVISLLEIAAGQGTNVGYTFEQLMDMIENVKDKSRVGVCMDTCHMFAAGYDIRTKDTYEATWKEFENVIGLDWLKAFHINDSKKPFKSNLDRHENLGKGYIGLEAFRLLLYDERFTGIPMVLETPGGDEWFTKNLKAMRGLVGKTKEVEGPALEEDGG
ncbi:MAG: Endonuclease 4 [Candidatus Marinimicrobia bacterium]|nr:Endonuclease 4 [Candidatus Neomarinimicrobiota bacterium]